MMSRNDATLSGLNAEKRVSLPSAADAALTFHMQTAYHLHFAKWNEMNAQVPSDERQNAALSSPPNDSSSRSRSLH